jgi:diaminohydroxyphosphoribosylaminopyrimidine deaminase/5-amino-6-(5-phosphoribosylamino)uracil reductase
LGTKNAHAAAQRRNGYVAPLRRRVSKSFMQTTIAEPMIWTDTDRRMMARALELAVKGVGRVSPGPLVGCVVVGPAGEIVGEGFYVFEEIKHAETIALDIAKEKARGGTAYVSLEPHAHYGRTAPCTDALIAAGIKRVVAPIEDLNPKVSGKGFAHLRAAGLKVDTGLLRDEATQVNEAYLHYMSTAQPFVHLKLAVSLDGKIATRTGDSRWITGPEARARAHELRHACDAILVGAGTVTTDDPLLSDRSGLPRRRPLVRVVLDRQLRLSHESRLATTTSEAPVLVFGDPESSNTAALRAQGVEIEKHRDLCGVLRELGSRSLQSVLVEGGSTIAGEFLDAGLVNKVTFFIAPKIIGGTDAPSAIAGRGAELMADALELQRTTVFQRGNDIEVTGYPQTHQGPADEG